MATTTANIRTITLTKPWLSATVVFGVILALFSFINLSGRAAPTVALNDQIVDELADAANLPTDQRMTQLTYLRGWQELALTNMPSEPFAWARLAYLRLATQSDVNAAFDALRMSDLVSPDEPRQLPERAFMWRQLRKAESSDELAYQPKLWTKAFRMQPDPTWNLAVQNKIVDEVGNAIKQTDADLYEQWKARVNNKNQ